MRAQESSSARAARRRRKPVRRRDAFAEEYLAYAEQIRPHVADTTRLLHEALRQGKRILFEAAQGSLLDVDHGTYPYVTSSNSSTAGIWSGSGVPARKLDRVIGVIKAYTTRVGRGPFPTELDDGPDGIGERIRKTGREYGTVTGRPRRCGWFDAVAARYTAALTGADELAVMLLDVLSELDEIQHRRRLRAGRPAPRAFSRATRSCWSAASRSTKRCPAGGRTSPALAASPTCRPRRGATSIASRELLDLPVTIVSVGPDREQTIFARNDREPRTQRSGVSGPLTRAAAACAARTRTMTTQSKSPDTLQRLADAGLDPAQLARHIAIIMDGNGRWAQQRGLPRIEGHARGVHSVRATVEECCRLGIGQLTLYCLSSENWKRPQTELDFLMALLEQYLIEERAEIMRAEHPLHHHRPPRRAARQRAARDRREHPPQPGQHRHGVCAWRSTTAAAPSWSMPSATLAQQVRDGQTRPRRTSTRRSSATPCTPPACPIRTCSSARPARCA